MAALINPHWNTITAGMRDLLQNLASQPFIHSFYLAGGTALALQIGHRRSVDLDFFSETNEVGEQTRQEIIRSLRPLNAQAIENVGGNLLLLVNNIHLGFFSYRYPLVQDTHQLEDIRLASMADIGLMKCDALITRGGRKDFYDLFYIAQQIPLEQLLELGGTKYAYYRDFPIAVIEQMIVFDNADRDVQPILFDAIPWQMVKDFFLQEASRLGQIWLRP